MEGLRGMVAPANLTSTLQYKSALPAVLLDCGRPIAVSRRDLLLRIPANPVSHPLAESGPTLATQP